MLVLARKNRESIVVGGAGSLNLVVRVTVVEVHKGMVKLGFQANSDVAFYREEVWDRILRGTSDARSEPKISTDRETGAIYPLSVE